MPPPPPATPSSFHLLSPEEELNFLRSELHLTDPARLLDRIISHFDILQARSAMLLSLVTLCLTISGFSGHRIASAGPLPAALLAAGLIFSVSAGILLLLGPLQLRWATRRRCGDHLDDTLIALLHLRNRRTFRYHAAATLLVIGLSSYVAAVVFSLAPGGTP